MTNYEELILEAHAAQLDLLRIIAKAFGAYHDDRAKNVEEKIEATLDSVSADEVDALK
jgi:hypothetical protein